MPRLSPHGAVLNVRPKQPDTRDKQEKTRDDELEPTTGYLFSPLFPTNNTNRITAFCYQIGSPHPPNTK